MIDWKKHKKSIIEWAIFLSVLGVLWLTGWHKHIISGVQRVVLSTGLITPDLEESSTALSAPLELMLEDETGKLIPLSSLRGKPVFINFWATWCPPCRAEMPGIQDLYGITKEDVNFAMIIVSDTWEKALQFKEDGEYSFPLYMARDPLPADLTGSVLPYSVVLDKQGRVRLHHEGIAQYDNDDFIDFMRGLVKEPANKKAQSSSVQ